MIQTAEDDFHTKEHITKHLTGARYDLNRERTEVNSWEEQDYLLWAEFKARTLGVDFYLQGVDIYHGLKISKDRGGRTEDVEVMKASNDEEMGKDIGAKIFRRVFGAQEKDGNGGK